jgi:hypothetical protein
LIARLTREAPLPQERQPDVYLTSHHVASPSSGHEGVNTFLYLHGSYTWTVLPPGVPDQNPGTLTAQSISVRPPGNRVRSYLDIIAPDEARWKEVRVGLMDFGLRYHGRGNRAGAFSAWEWS